MSRLNQVSLARATAAGVFALALAGVAGLVGCASSGPYVWAHQLKLPASANEPPIQPRDVILVHVRGQSSVSGEFTVREDGHFLHPALGNVLVRDLTPGQIAALLGERFVGVVVNPQVTVSLVRTAPIRVNVVGEVRTPGNYELARDRSVTAALAAAGWLTEFAGTNRIFVVSPGTTRVRFRANELTGADPIAGKYRLRDGDVVVVE